MRKHGKTWKKAMVLVLLTLLLFSLTGCSGREGEKQPDDRVEDDPGKDKADKDPGWKGEITAEDFQPGNRLVMKTEKGYYYYHHEKAENGTLNGAFRYLDSAIGKDIYLCNKPECRHDGNIFCVATNEKYVIGQVCLYNGRIFATALEKTDTQYLYKLLAIALDGSEMSEIATYMTINKMTAESSGQRPLVRDNGNLPIHRNKAVISLAAIGQLDDTYYYGTAILDLDTGKVSYLDEEPLSKENSRIEKVSAYGDSIYYYRKEGRKNVLHRYCVKDGTDESYKLPPGFSGIYVVLDEDNIVYRRSAENVLYLYHPSTGESEEAKTLMTSRKVTTKDGLEYSIEDKIEVAGLMTDGTYLYVAQVSWTMVSNDDHEETKVSEIYVLDRNLEIIAVVNLAEAIPEGMDDVLTHTNEYNWSFLEDEIYTVFWQKDGDRKTAVYKCKRSDFLEGNPKFEFLYKQLR